MPSVHSIKLKHDYQLRHILISSIVLVVESLDLFQADKRVRSKIWDWCNLGAISLSTIGKTAHDKGCFLSNIDEMKNSLGTSKEACISILKFQYSLFVSWNISERFICMYNKNFLDNGVPASGCDNAPLSYLIYSALFMIPFCEGGAILLLSISSSET